MEFKDFRKILKDHFDSMTVDVDYLFSVEVDKDEMWNLYLDSFPEGSNKIFRKRREYDCSCCRQFVKAIGNVVVIKNDTVHTIWDLELGDNVFQVVADRMAAYIKSKSIVGVYLSDCSKVGTEYNYEQYEDGTLKKWDHFFLLLQDKFVNHSNKSIANIQGEYRDVKNVFKRSLDEISLDAIDVVLELISSNTLYKGKEWKFILTEFKKYKKEYEGIVDETKRDLFAWINSIKAGTVIGKIRNHSIGTLLVNISEGMDLDLAVTKYEQITAPQNYKRPKAIFTKRMLEDAKKTITELGYLESLNRRFATLDDITINNILFSNRDAVKRISGADDIFSEMEKETVVNPKRFSKIEEISAHDFINNILPTAKEIEAFVENKHEKNFVSMIAPKHPDAPTMFKWGNGLSWAYTGNITDSDIKENVKASGGNVNGVLRFSIQWNESGKDNSDLDAHCSEPDGNEIYFCNCRAPRMSKMSGQLDVDITHPGKNIAVENIIYTNHSKMQAGIYKFFVNQFHDRGSKGFKAEIECNGEIHSYEYNKAVKGNVMVAYVELSANGEFKIIDKLEGNSLVTSRNIWGVDTNQFTPVSVVCYSPNYFDEQDGIGHRHLFFMLNGCKNSEEPNGFYNEYLKNELLEHKRVFEALGSKCHVDDAEDHLSGIGFSMTKRDELVVKVKGATERIMKIKF